MAFDEVWDEDAPDGQLITISQLDNYIRATRASVRERMEGDPAAPLTGLIEVGTWPLAPMLRQGVSRFHFEDEADVGTLGVQDGRGMFTADVGDGHPKLYHLADAGAEEIAYLNRDGSRSMLGTLTVVANEAAVAAMKEVASLELTTTAGAYTVTDAIGLHIKAMTKGAGVAITNQYGLKIQDMDDAELAINSYSLYTGAGKIRFGGSLFINDNDNTYQTGTAYGITVNVGTGSEAFNAKDPDLAHGITSVQETDTFCHIRTAHSTEGGVNISGFSETTIGMELQPTATTADTTKSTSGRGCMNVYAMKKTGTTTTNYGANENLMVIASGGLTKFIFDADGDSHQDVGTAWTNFDTHDDVALLNLMSAHVTRQDDPLRQSFGAWLEQGRDVLEKIRLVTFNADGHHFVNMSRLAMLHTGAIRQLSQRLDDVMRLLPSTT